MNRATYHLDCFSGLAGDMFLGACLDIGLPLEALGDAIASMELQGISLEARRSTRGGLGGVRFRVLGDGDPIDGRDPEEGAVLAAGPALASAYHDHDSEAAHRHEHSHRSLSEIRRRIAASGLESAVRERADQMFCRLGEVEAQIHGVDVEQVHFHEVGAIDSIVDIIGAAVAIEWLDSSSFSVGSIVVGSGTIASSHGVLPIPAPATSALLAHVEVPISPGPPGELLTPTGALILSQLRPRYAAAPKMKVEAQGYGLGRWELTDRANAVRLTRGVELVEQPSAAPPEGGAEEQGDTIAVIECQVDDLSGEGFGYLQERLLTEGALDCFFTPVQMKKGRPGVLITVLAHPEEMERLAGSLMNESGSLGCRYRFDRRFVADRKITTVQTPWGEVRIKCSSLAGQTLARTPEFEDCRTLARAEGIPWRVVHLEAQRLALELTSGDERGE